MGVTDGAAFVITLCMIFLPGMSSIGMVVCSMIGSALEPVSYLVLVHSFKMAYRQLGWQLSERLLEHF